MNARIHLAYDNNLVICGTDDNWRETCGTRETALLQKKDGTWYAVTNAGSSNCSAMRKLVKDEDGCYSKELVTWPSSEEAIADIKAQTAVEMARTINDY